MGKRFSSDHVTTALLYLLQRAASGKQLKRLAHRDDFRRVARLLRPIAQRSSRDSEATLTAAPHDASVRRDCARIHLATSNSWKPRPAILSFAQVGRGIAVAREAL